MQIALCVKGKQHQHDTDARTAHQTHEATARSNAHACRGTWPSLAIAHEEGELGGALGAPRQHRQRLVKVVYILGIAQQEVRLRAVHHRSMVSAPPRRTTGRRRGSFDTYVVVEDVAHAKLLEGHPIAHSLVQELVEENVLVPASRPCEPPHPMTSHDATTGEGVPKRLGVAEDGEDALRRQKVAFAQRLEEHLMKWR